MKNRLGRIAVAVLALAVLGAAAGTPAFAAGKVNAIVIAVKGKVEVKRTDSRDFTELKLNDMLSVGDVVKTGSDGQASVATKGGAEVRLNANSSFELTPSGTMREQFKLSLGQLWTRMLHRKARVDVRTPSAVCAVRGTEADIEQRDLLTVKVYEGHVDVSNTGGKQKLTAGQMSTVAGGAAPTAPKQMGAGDKGTWQEGMNKDLGEIQQSMDLLTKTSGDKRLILEIKGPDGKIKKIEAPLKKK